MSARHVKFVVDALAPHRVPCRLAVKWLQDLPAKMSLNQAYKSCKNLDFLLYVYNPGSFGAEYRCGWDDCNICESLPTIATVLRRYKKAVPWAEFKKHLLGTK